jgi:diguanylate cyclase (GGDEF)-like protein
MTDGILQGAKPISPRALTTYYASALMVIAGLTLASHLVLTYVLHHNQGTAAIINISGRQRMLSQRIASLAAEYRLGDPTAQAALIEATNAFEASESSLSGSVTGTAAERRALDAIYTGGPDPLDAEVARYIADARRVASQPAGAPAAAAPLQDLLAEARAPLLTKLNDVVTVHQRETEHVLAELEMLQLAILAIVLLTLAIEALTIFRPMISRIVLYTSEIMRLATTDPLTELMNRRGFLTRCIEENARARRYGRPLSLLMLDIDHFKVINDSFGHEGGDEALRAMSASLRQSLRGADLAGRFGGEEFAILLPETDLPGATVFAERLRRTIAELPVMFHRQRVRLTVSIGVTRVGNDIDGIDRALQEADRLMYAAKENGRNRVVAG